MKTRSAQLAFSLGWRLVLVGLVVVAGRDAPAQANDAFARGVEAYRAGEFAMAAKEFRAAVEAVPASGTWLNLGLTEWRRGRVGPAILAWEKVRWLDPFDPRARDNLRYARQIAGVEPPELSWYEQASAWLPAAVWGWLLTGSVWLTLALAVLPGVLRWRRPAGVQALAAMSLAALLASLPAHFGVMTRARIGFVLQKDAMLRLTPTAEAETVAKLSAGEPGRALRTRGKYVLVRTAHGQGWLAQTQFGVVGAD